MDFVPVRLSTLRANIRLGFDLYLKFSHKYLLYVNNQDVIDIGRYSSLKEKKLKRLFIDSLDEKKYQEFLDKSLDDAMDSSSNMNAKDRAGVVSGVSSDAVNEMRNNPQSPEAYRKTQKAANGLINVVMGNPDVLKVLFAMESEGDDIMVRSAVNTSSLSVRLGQIMGLPKEKIEVIGMAGLLRDICASKMDEKVQKLFTTPYDQFTDDDWKIYRQHPVQSAELLQEKDYVTKEILNAIASHEEKNSGEGFPNKLTNLSKELEILSICTTFDRQVTCLGMSAKDVMKNMAIDELGNFDLELINMLKKVLKNDGLI